MHTHTRAWKHTYTHTHTHTHTHTPPGVPNTVSVPVPLLTLPCRLCNVHEYCPSSFVVTIEMNSRAVRGLTWYLAVLETSNGAPLYLHCTVGCGTVSRLGKQSKKARPYSKTVRLVGPLWMTGSSERQNQRERMKCTTVMQAPNQHYLSLEELYLSSHLGSLCCDDAQILSKPNQHIRI